MFRAGWALLVERDGTGLVRVVEASAGAPDADDLTFPWLPLTSARRMDAGGDSRDSEAWVPPRWDALGMELAAAPVGGPDRAVLVGRPGGPRFRASEILRLAHLAGIAATVARPPALA